MDKVVVKYIDIDSIEKNFDLVISLVDNDRLIKAKRYRQKSDQLLSLGAGYLMKKILEMVRKNQSKREDLFAKQPFFQYFPFWKICCTSNK